MLDKTCQLLSTSANFSLKINSRRRPSFPNFTIAFSINEIAALTFSLRIRSIHKPKSLPCFMVDRSHASIHRSVLAVAWLKRFDPGGKLNWMGPLSLLANTQENLRNDSECECGCLYYNLKRSENTPKNFRNTQKNKNLLINKRILKPKYDHSGGPTFALSLPGGRFKPLLPINHATECRMITPPCM